MNFMCTLSLQSPSVLQSPSPPCGPFTQQVFPLLGRRDVAKSAKWETAIGMPGWTLSLRAFCTWGPGGGGGGGGGHVM